MRQPGVSRVVVGASSPKEIEENVFSATFLLPDAIWDEVDERMRRAARRSGNMTPPPVTLFAPRLQRKFRRFGICRWWHAIGYRYDRDVLVH